MTFATDIENDYTLFDDVEDVTIEDVEGNTDSVKALQQPMDKTALSGALYSVESSDIRFSLFSATISGVEIQADGKLTRADSSVYTIMHASRKTLSTRWVVYCRAEV